MPYTAVLDSTEVVRSLGAMEKQLPYAFMQSLNELGRTFQSNERKSIQANMVIRRPWVLDGVKIDRGDFATKQKLSVRVHIDDQRDFLDKFEDGGTRSPLGSSRSLAVPMNVRRTKSQIIAKTQTPKSFQFQQGFSSTKSQWTVLKGERGTFLLQRPDGSGLILQRRLSGTKRQRNGASNKGRAQAQLGPSRWGNRNFTARRWGHDPNVTTLWNLRPTTRVPRILHFGDNATSVLSTWPGTFEKWYLEALRTAR